MNSSAAMRITAREVAATSIALRPPKRRFVAVSASVTKQACHGARATHLAARARFSAWSPTPARQRGSVLRVVHDGGIWSREEEILVACVSPANEVRRLPVLVVHLQDFTVTIMLADVMPLDDNPVPDFRVHLGSIHCVEDSWP